MGFYFYFFSPVFFSFPSHLEAEVFLDEEESRERSLSPAFFIKSFHLSVRRSKNRVAFRPTKRFPPEEVAVGFD